MNRLLPLLPLLLVVAFARTAPAATPTTRPNVLFIICDDLTTTAQPLNDDQRQLQAFLKVHQ